MKNGAFMIISALLLSACSIINIEKGSGTVVRESYNTQAFKELEISSVFDVELVPSDVYRVVIETDDNLQSMVEIENSNGKLSVKMKDGHSIGSKTTGKIFIYLKDLTSITNTSVGNISTSAVLKSSQLYFKNSAVGKTSLQLEAKNIEFENSAVGTTNLTGECDSLKLTNKAVGATNAKGMICNYLQLDNRAVGSTNITVNIEANITNAAVGTLDIYGNAVIKNLNNTAVGRFTKH